MSSFWLILKQQWAIEDISIFSNSSLLEWRAELSDTILKWDYPRTIPANSGLIWFSGFREEDLNVIFYQNIPNLHNRYKSAERKISQKNPEVKGSLELIFVCLLFLTMPTLDKTYLFIYLFIYSASSLSKMAADSVLSYKPRFAN